MNDEFDNARTDKAIRAKLGRPVEWCQCEHASHFDSGQDEHTYGAHVEAEVRTRNGKHVCRHCGEKHQ